MIAKFAPFGCALFLLFLLLLLVFVLSCALEDPFLDEVDKSTLFLRLRRLLGACHVDVAEEDIEALLEHSVELLHVSNVLKLEYVLLAQVELLPSLVHNSLNCVFHFALLFGPFLLNFFLFFFFDSLPDEPTELVSLDCVGNEHWIRPSTFTKCLLPLEV